MAPLENGYYTINSGLKSDSFVTFPANTSEPITMEPHLIGSRQRVKVTKDEKGYEFEVDGMIPHQAALGAYLAKGLVEINNNLEGNVNNRTIFQVDQLIGGPKNAYGVRTIDGRLSWTAHGIGEPITIENPIPSPVQIWIFTKV